MIPSHNRNSAGGVCRNELAIRLAPEAKPIADGVLAQIYLIHGGLQSDEPNYKAIQHLG